MLQISVGIIYNDYISHSYFLANIIEHHMELVQIYFDAATFDEIEKDVKVTLEAQLGLIGGTMGLLTGFSILSGVEIIYFIVKFFMSFRRFSHEY